MAPGTVQQRCSVSDDELVHTPVFIAPIWQVTANDDWDLPGPVVGKSQDMRAGAPALQHGTGGRSTCHRNPLPHLGGLTMNEPEIYRIKYQLPQMERPRAAAALWRKDPCLRDLLEFLHGNEQWVCLPLQLHHHRGTHPAGTDTGWRDKKQGSEKVTMVSCSSSSKVT